MSPVTNARSFVTVVATASLSAYALNLAATHATRVLPLRTRARLHRLTHRRSTSGCQPDRGDWPGGDVVLDHVDGTHTGLCVALLREKFATHSPTTLSPETDPSHGLDLRATPCIEASTEEQILARHDYEDVLRSIIETAMVLVLDLAMTQIKDCRCDDPECASAEVDVDVLYLVAGKKMTEFALGFEIAADDHAEQCPDCAAAEHHAPGLVRARFCRDIADDLLANSDHDDTLVRGVPLTAAFDVTCAIIDTMHRGYGESPAAQIEQVASGLIRALATGDVTR